MQSTKLRRVSRLPAPVRPRRGVARRSASVDGGAAFIPCRQCLLRSKPLFRPFSADELRFISKLKKNHVTVARNGEILREGDKPRAVYTLYEGWAIRYTRLADNSRQIFDVLLPGDTIGVGAALLGRSRHSVQAITAATFCAIAADFVTQAIDNEKSLALALFRTQLEDEARADLRLSLLGRRSGAQRVGYFMLETYDRLRQRGMTEGMAACPFPLQHMHLADALGLSRVHVTRTLQELRRRKLAEIRGGSLIIRNRERLAMFSGYSRPAASATRTLL